MENLLEMIEKVKEEKLSKDTLEAYHTSVTYLDNLYRMELAPIEKEEAKYMSFKRDDESVAEVKIQWKATPRGQRQIELSHMLKITPKLLQSLKTRLYSIY